MNLPSIRSNDNDNKCFSSYTLDELREVLGRETVPEGTVPVSMVDTGTWTLGVDINGSFFLGSSTTKYNIIK